MQGETAAWVVKRVVLVAMVGKAATETMARQAAMVAMADLETQP